MIYTYSEVKELLSKAIPKDADTDIVIRALAAELNSRMNKHDIISFSACLSLIMPEEMSLSDITRGFMDALTNISLRYTATGRLFSNLKIITEEIYTTYIMNIVKLCGFPDWKLKHEPELRCVLHNSDNGLVPQELKPIIREMVKV